MLQGMDKNKKQLLESVDSILFEHLAFVSLDHWFIFKVCSKPVMDILWSTCNSSWWHKWAPTVITTTEKNIKYQKLWYLKPIIPLAQHQHSVWLTHIGYARTIPLFWGQFTVFHWSILMKEARILCFCTCIIYKLVSCCSLPLTRSSYIYIYIILRRILIPLMNPKSSLLYLSLQVTSLPIPSLSKITPIENWNRLYCFCSPSDNGSTPSLASVQC